MIYFIEVTKTGEILNSCGGNVEDLDLIRPHYKGHLVEVSEQLEKPSEWYWADPGIKPKGPRPGMFHDWDWESKSWLQVDSAEELAREIELVRDTRRKAYPALADQLDALWKELSFGVKSPEAKAMAAAIAGVKLNNPKPN